MPNAKKQLKRIAEALERISPPPPNLPDFRHEAYMWNGARRRFDGVEKLGAVPLSALVGIDRARDTLFANTRQFAEGKPANNALLWGARGMGKSSLIKAVYLELRSNHPLTLIEILREDLASLGEMLDVLRGADRRFIVFCDDLSFEYDEAVYKSLKAALDGGVRGVPENVVFYASSNRRHLMARDMIENERRAAIHDHEAEEEKVSLSDRFGLWLGFHKADQENYFEMIRRYLAIFGLEASEADWKPEAVEWSVTRGARSGRVAYQFAQDFAAKWTRE